LDQKKKKKNHYPRCLTTSYFSQRWS